MEQFLTRARATLAEFLAAVDAFDSEQTAGAPAAGLTDKQIKSLAHIVVRLRAAAKHSKHSVTQISGETALDIVDLQVRLEGETAALASALKALGEIATKAPDILTTKEPLTRRATPSWPESSDSRSSTSAHV